MSSVGIIGNGDIVSGFRLGGVREGVIVDSKEEAIKAFDEFLEKEISVIIITKKIANEIRDHINKKIGSQVLPMVIEIPEKGASTDQSPDQLAELIKRVIGVEMVK